ncbi:MAG TPA: hypothetical protein VM146_05745 [Steroidobacteraceae bacterium]|nr:hypothetical protein [Steroidobacteraceae bacterium]
MTAELHSGVARLMKKYARDLGQITPSDSLDARIGHLVAAPPEIIRPGMFRREAAPRAARHWRRPFAWAAAASLAVLAISSGIIIGMRLERSSNVAAVNSLAREAAQQVRWAPEDLGMWPSDSVALTIPAEYSPQGTLVAVKPNSKSMGKRYWIDVVVSNDGTVRIERIVPAESAAHQRTNKDGVTLQFQ